MSSISCREDQQRALLAELAEVEAEEARVFARKMVLRAEMDALWNAPSAVGAQEQFGVLELAGTARIGQARASSQLVDGTRLVQELPGTLRALTEGRMFRETAVLVLEKTRNCSPAVTREVERRLLPVITDANTTDVRRLLVTVIPEVEADLDPDLTRQRLDSARSRRSVWQDDRGDGMVGTHAEIDAVSARRWALDFEELVRAQKIADHCAGVRRTADQRRADVFAQLPSRFLALLQAVRKGQTEQLLALALADPDLADDLEAIAATLPFDPDVPHAPEPDHPEDYRDHDHDHNRNRKHHDGTAAASEPARATDHVWVADDIPHPTEPPPDPAEPEAPDPRSLAADEVPHWTDLSLLELASAVIGLPVNNPMVLAVHVPMSTALEVDNRPARIDQGGALPASLVRQLIPDAALVRVLVDSDSGVPIGIDSELIPAPAAPTATRERLAPLLTMFRLTDQAEPQHDPNAALRRFVQLRDQRCTGIGCSQPASRCHLDHETAYPTGPTAAWNLSAKSARCHRAKHAGWTVTRHGPGPQHGEVTWTSPLGHSYTRLSTWRHPGADQHSGGDELQPTQATVATVIELELPAHAA